MANETGHERGRRLGRLVPLIALVVLACAIVLVIVSGRGDSPSGRCGDVTYEQIDPQSALHLLPSSPEPPYRSDPPTSGPHIMGPPITGAVDDVLSRPVQAGILERGSVLVQYNPGMEPGEVARLRALGGPDVVVAPNPVAASVVATAWGRRLTCDGVDAGALRSFVDSFAGKGSQMGGSG